MEMTWKLLALLMFVLLSFAPSVFAEIETPPPARDIMEKKSLFIHDGTTLFTPVEQRNIPTLTREQVCPKEAAVPGLPGYSGISSGLFVRLWTPLAQERGKDGPGQVNEPATETRDDRRPVISTLRTMNEGDGFEPPLGISFDSNQTAERAIERSLFLFSDRLKERFHLWLERSARYMDVMKEVLREKNMPEDLVFLPIVESGFNPHAYSPARAAGPWQFIEATAKRYGLIVDWWRDERKDPVKSTEAAASYLKDLYRMFGAWNLALAAYNAGEGRIMRALKNSGSTDYWALLDTKQIRDETKSYVSHYIAASMIAQTPEDFGFTGLAYQEPMEYDEVTVYQPLDLEVIAQCANTSVKEIRDLNPELRRWSTPPNVSAYTVRIPKGSGDVFSENLSEIPRNDRFSIETYKVKKGDTIKKVAQKESIPVSAILALNNMGGIERVKAGDVLFMPPREKFATDKHDQVSCSVSSQGKKKTVAFAGPGKKSKKETQKAVVKSKSKGRVKTKRV
jgi:membrane-bound lytic murein transglycosylase D